MPDYNSDIKAFKKWGPVKKWLQNNTGSITAASGPAVVHCDAVNKQVNTGFVYMRDGLNDVWYTPAQFIKSHGGDCEDFSIYKMYRLAQMGIAYKNMEIVICTDKKSREHHAVLRVFSGQSQYILDNQTRTLLSKTSFNQRYSPIYAIGMMGWRICTV